MTVLSEEKLVNYLSQVLELSRAVLAKIPSHGTAPVDDSVVDRYHEFVNQLSIERERDAHLQHESWNWILLGKTDYNNIQMYGRLAWINLQLLELL
ncbi:MAG: hypothetical protein ACKVX7_06520 [Planctomycetota bacterium]